MRLGEKLAQLLDQRRPYAVDIVELGARILVAAGEVEHGGAPAGEVAIVAGQHLGVDLADEADAQGVDEALERDRPAGLDGFRELLDFARTPALKFSQAGELVRLPGQPEQSHRAPDQPGLEQLGHLLAAEALDVERLAADEMA